MSSLKRQPSSGWTPDPRAEAISRIRTVLQQSIGHDRHPGAQVYASVNGEVLADLGLGEARLGTPMTPDSIVSWQCNTKPVTGVAVCQLWEQGRVDIDAPVARYIPEFAQNGKEAVTLRHLLTHTARFKRGGSLYGGMNDGFDAMVERLCQVELAEGSVPGERARYEIFVGYLALAAVVSRIDGRPFPVYVRQEIFEPLGMTDCWIGVEPAREEEVGNRMAFLYDTQGERPELPLMLGGFARGKNLTACSPGTGGIGPMRQLGRFYEALLASLRGEPGSLLKKDTVEAMIESPDLPGGHGAWGLGLQVASGFYGKWFPRAFGHEGLNFSMAFADPQYGVVVTVMVNGLTRGGSLRDLHMVSQVVYEVIAP